MGGQAAKDVRDQTNPRHTNACPSLLGGLPPTSLSQEAREKPQKEKKNTRVKRSKKRIGFS